MESISSCLSSFENVKVDEYWNFGDENEDRMHQIHTYPAKFPSFITSKAIDYAESENIDIETVGDIFCGCGTVAYESGKKGFNFWGCDVNPVAALIARVKSKKLNLDTLSNYYSSILDIYSDSSYCSFNQKAVNERILYWFEQDRIVELYRLLNAIEKVCINDIDYKEFFLCAFSNILKSTSRWLTKSIKPTVDKKKNTKSALFYFKKQFKKMYRANSESQIVQDAGIEIEVLDSLKIEQNEKVDLLVTSPPYVTSYEYADLHQLSLLWLGFTDDYRVFRKDTIGSIYDKKNLDNNTLNKIGQEILDQLKENEDPKARTKAIKKYYADMEKITENVFNLVRNNGMVLFVIGNTEYKGVKIRNAEHLALSMHESGFREIKVTRRKISNKILTPYRDKNGKFSKDKKGKKVYSEEFIVVGRKLDV